MEVLEFGCGTGSTALAHAPFVRHILATDISEKMLEIARAKAADGSVHNVTFQQGTLDDLDKADGTFGEPEEVIKIAGNLTGGFKKSCGFPARQLQQLFG